MEPAHCGAEVYSPSPPQCEPGQNNENIQGINVHGTKILIHEIKNSEQSDSNLNSEPMLKTSPNTFAIFHERNNAHLC